MLFEETTPARCFNACRKHLVNKGIAVQVLPQLRLGKAEPRNDGGIA